MGSSLLTYFLLPLFWGLNCGLLYRFSRFAQVLLVVAASAVSFVAISDCDLVQKLRGKYAGHDFIRDLEDEHRQEMDHA